MAVAIAVQKSREVRSVSPRLTPLIDSPPALVFPEVNHPLIDELQSEHQSFLMRAIETARLYVT